MPLLKTVYDVVDNHLVTAAEAVTGVFRGYTEGGNWTGWTTTWPFVGRPNRLRLVRGMVELDDSTLVVKQGVHLKLGVLVRQGSGILFLDPKTGPVQGFGNRVSFGPAETEWGIASCFPAGQLADQDYAITCLTFQRYLP